MGEHSTYVYILQAKGRTLYPWKEYLNGRPCHFLSALRGQLRDVAFMHGCPRRVTMSADMLGFVPLFSRVVYYSLTEFLLSVTCLNLRLAARHFPVSKALLPPRECKYRLQRCAITVQSSTCSAELGTLQLKGMIYRMLLVSATLYLRNVTLRLEQIR